jgi:hypothetical protein
MYALFLFFLIVYGMLKIMQDQQEHSMQKAINQSNDSTPFGSVVAFVYWCFLKNMFV